MLLFIIGLVIGVVAFISIEMIINYRKKKKKARSDTKDKN